MPRGQGQGGGGVLGAPAMRGSPAATGRRDDTIGPQSHVDTYADTQADKHIDVHADARAGRHGNATAPAYAAGQALVSGRNWPTA